MGPLAVRETSADRERNAAGQTHGECTEPALVPASSRLVPDDDGLGVVERLDLEQRGGAAGGILGARLAQHQSFAPQGFNAPKFAAQVIRAVAQLVLVRLSEGREASPQGVPHELNAILEAAARARRIEDQVADFSPQLGLVLPANDADGALELLAVDPQLAIQRSLG